MRSGKKPELQIAQRLQTEKEISKTLIFGEPKLQKFVEENNYSEAKDIIIHKGKAKIIERVSHYST